LASQVPVFSCWCWQALGQVPIRLFAIIAVLSLAIGAYIVLRVPQLLVRTVIWFAANTLYRVKIIGRDNVPDGGIVFVGNHLSFIDLLFVIHSCDREMRCVVGKDIETVPWMSWVAKATDMIVVEADGSQQHLNEVFQEARRALKSGQAVLVSVEGTTRSRGAAHALPPRHARFGRWYRYSGDSGAYRSPLGHGVQGG
jgi:acyl-[acyl-carrier-protein]-phospholipid O-acyltransferase/long-chain-fatty-acid--[acyl-carrier-protein] ligase